MQIVFAIQRTCPPISTREFVVDILMLIGTPHLCVREIWPSNSAEPMYAENKYVYT